ncbi:hypothetical protein FCH28_30980 [Streptomyces piniterrae]|uniref:Uncharacterized protein n=1 Tax=Streptomyces piniterrae TaxID=2571125 RepID=A0A4U0MSV8_9ACTN|nr:hypothetical protein FCH28_30980 [Streptomyces piniterrae]
MEIAPEPSRSHRATVTRRPQPDADGESTSHVNRAAPAPDALPARHPAAPPAPAPAPPAPAPADAGPEAPAAARSAPARGRRASDS